MKMNIENLAHPLTAPVFSLSSSEGGEGRGEEAKIFPVQIPSPHPSPRLGGERESGAVSKCASQHPRLTRLGLIGCSLFDIGCWMFPLMIFSALPLHAQTNAAATNTLSALLPPYGELPPTFTEQHGTFIIFGGLGIIALAAFGCWLIFRPKPKVIIPPEVQARQSLEILREQPEDGVILSRIPQVLRNYFIAAFQLVPGEFTTAEFSRTLASCDRINPELAAAAAEFLRDCDAHKFSATAGPAKLEAANRALNLVEQAEQHRAQLRQLAATQTQDSRA